MMSQCRALRRIRLDPPHKSASSPCDRANRGNKLGEAITCRRPPQPAPRTVQHAAQPGNVSLEHEGRGLDAMLTLDGEIVWAPPCRLSNLTQFPQLHEVAVRVTCDEGVPLGPTIRPESNGLIPGVGSHVTL